MLQHLLLRLLAGALVVAQPLQPSKPAGPGSPPGTAAHWYPPLPLQPLRWGSSAPALGALPAGPPPQPPQHQLPLALACFLGVAQPLQRSKPARPWESSTRVAAPALGVKRASARGAPSVPSSATSSAPHSPPSKKTRPGAASSAATSATASPAKQGGLFRPAAAARPAWDSRTALGAKRGPPPRSASSSPPPPASAGRRASPCPP